MGTSTTAKIQIEVETRTDAAVAQIGKLTGATNSAAAATLKLNAAIDKGGAVLSHSSAATSKAANAAAEAQGRFARFDAAVSANTATMGRSSTAMNAGSAAARAFGQMSNQAAAGVQGLKAGLMPAAAAFGPFGVAAAGAAIFIWDLVDSQNAAAEAAAKHTAEVKKQSRELAEAKAQAKRSAAEEKYVNEQNKNYWSDRQREIDGRAEELKGIEDTLAQHGRGADMVAYLKQEAEIRAANASAMGDHEGSAQIIRDLELEILGIKGDQLRSEKAITHEKVEQAKYFDVDRRLKPQKSEGFNSRAEERASEEFAAELGLRDRVETADGRFKRDPRSAADIKAQQKDLAEEEKKLRDAEEKAAEAAHKAELKRIDETIEHQEKLGQAIGDSVGSAAAAIMQAGDLSASGFKKVLGAWGKVESIKLGAVAISEGVQAAVSAAFLNIPQAAAHGNAAALALAGSLTIAGMTGAVGGFGSISKGVKGYSGSAFGPANDSGSANDRGPTGTSQRDTTAVSESSMQRSASANAGGPVRSGGTVNHFHPGSIQPLGQITNDAARIIAQAIQRADKSALGKATV